MFTGPHIFSVCGPGAAALHDMTGFHAIGVGEAFAWEKLVLLETDKDKTLEEVLYNAFDAKANAEIVQGVGYEWDAEIIVRGHRPRIVPKPIRRLIDDLFDSTPRSAFKKQEKEPKRWKERLKNYCDSVLVPKPRKTGRRRGDK